MKQKLATLSLLMLMALCSIKPSSAADGDDAQAARVSGSDGKKISQFQGPGANSVQNPSFDPDVNPTKEGEEHKQAKSEPVNMDGILKRAFTHFPRTAASFTAGVFLGTPLAMVRKSREEVVSMARDITDHSDNPLYLGLAGTFALPFGAWAGTIDGAISSVKNSALYSVDRPFSKDSFSLGDLR